MARQAVADPPMTMTEAIIARRAGQPSVQPGDNVWVDVDKLMTHDVCGPGTFGVFEKEFGESAKVRLACPCLLLPVELLRCRKCSQTCSMLL